MKASLNRRKIVAEYYDRTAEEYDNMQYFTPRQKVWDRAAKDIFLEMVGNISDKRVLDCGCGSGRFTDICTKTGAYVVSLDISKKMLEVAQKKINRPLHSVRGSVFHIPFERDCFDIIVCSQVMTHLHEYDEPLKEMYRILRKNGIIIVDIRNIFRPVRLFLKIKQRIFNQQKDYLPDFISIFRFKKIAKQNNLQFIQYEGFGGGNSGYNRRKFGIWKFFSPTFVIKLQKS